MTENSSSAISNPPPEVDEAEILRKQKKSLMRSKRLALLAYTAARLIFRSLTVRMVNKLPELPSDKGCIFVTWHGRTLIPANVFRNRGYWALVSLSRDGEMQSHIFTRFGYQIIRGSTGRGGVKGALQMARKVKEGGVLAFTPDGPRGPSHKVQPGVILMAQKSGVPIVPLGISCTKRWLITKSWDSYMVPKPFAKAYWIYGEPIFVPLQLSDADREHYAELVEVAINRLERQAESLAGHNDYPAAWRTELPADAKAS